jgi:transposase
MEATGVYSEALAYFVHANGYRIAVEPPLKVKRAFDTCGHKSDAVDSRQIAEYACRCVDELAFWQPKAAILEQIKVLLTTPRAIQCTTYCSSQCPQDIAAQGSCHSFG